MAVPVAALALKDHFGAVDQDVGMTAADGLLVVKAIPSSRSRNGYSFSNPEAFRFRLAFRIMRLSLAARERFLRTGI